MKQIDLNMDLGEGMGNDAALMPYISSCNIACGGHYGDYDSVKSTLLLAQQHGVKAGAHPSFEDRDNFGRTYLDWDESRFRESVSSQIQLFQQVAQELKIPFHHIKMHGALYHATATRPDYAAWTIKLMKENDPDILLYVPSCSLLEKEAQKSGILYCSEAFADRRYHSNATLVARQQENAVIRDVAKLVNQLAIMVHQEKVLTVEEDLISITAQTYCIHGDNKEIVHRFDEVLDALQLNGIQIG